MKTATDNMNFNISDNYIQTSRSLGKTNYFNLNTNTMTTIPWGSLDWLNVLVSEAFAFAICGGLIYIVGHFFKVW